MPAAAAPGLAYFTDEMLQGYVERAVHEALVNLEARPARRLAR